VIFAISTISDKLPDWTHANVETFDSSRQILLQILIAKSEAI
jgi:hypothetical protein